MKCVPTVLEFIEKEYALIVREEDKEPLIELFESHHLKCPEDAIRRHYSPCYVDFYVEEITIMSKEFYENDGYHFIEAADFLAANGFDGVVEPAATICCDTLDTIL